MLRIGRDGRLIQILFLIITCKLIWVTYIFSSLSYLVFHQVNYPSTRDRKIRLLEPGQNLSLLERKTRKEFFLYILKWQVQWTRLRPLTYECLQDLVTASKTYFNDDPSFLHQPTLTFLLWTVRGKVNHRFTFLSFLIQQWPLTFASILVLHITFHSQRTKTWFRNRL